MDTFYIILITILGWFASFSVMVRGNRKNLKDNARLKVYEQFWHRRSILQRSLSKLITQVQFGPPYTLMEAKQVYGKVTNNQSDIIKGNQDAVDTLNKYFNDLFSSKSKSSEDILEFWRDLEMWIHQMPELEEAMRVLIAEYHAIFKRLNEYYTYISTKDRYNWKTWDRVEISTRANSVWEEFHNLSAYIEDMMSLIHNELVTPMFKYQKRTRVPNDQRYMVLTKKGLTVIQK